MPAAKKTTNETTGTEVVVEPVEEVKAEEVELFHADGRSRKVTDPSVIVNLEFNGWSRDQSVFKKN